MISVTSNKNKDYLDLYCRLSETKESEFFSLMVTSRDLLIFFLALLSLSQSGNIAKFSNASVEVLGFWRLFIAGLLALLYALYIYTRTPQSSRPSLRFSRDPLVLVSGLLFFVHLWTYKFSAQNTTIAHSMILFALNPLWTALVSQRLVQDKVSIHVKLASVVGFLGIALIALSFENQRSSNLWGNLAALLSGFFYSAYFLASKKSRKEVDNVYFLPVLFLVTSLLFGITGVFRDQNFFPSDSRFWPSVAALIIFPTFIGHASMIYLVKRININWLSSGKLIEVPLASLVAFFAFGQSLSAATLLAFGFTAVSIYLLFRKT